MTSHPMQSSTPPGVKALSALVLLDGGVMLWNGISFLLNGDTTAATIAIGLSTLQILLAAGLWMLEPYAWGAAMLVLGVAFTFEVAPPVHLPAAAVTAAIALYLLTQRDRFET